MSSTQPQIQVVPHNSITEYRYLVYFENQALWKETDPKKRALMACQLAEWTTTLAEMEEAEVASISSVSTSRQQD